MYENCFAGKVALVTGSSRGIGREIAFHLARYGATVIINANTSIDQLQETFKELKDICPEAMMIKADITNQNEVDNMFNIIKNTFGRIDILVNNAGIAKNALLTDTTLDDWRKVLSTNLDSAYLVSSEALKMMVPIKSGNIINISSIWGIHGASCEVAYSTSKGGLITFTKALAKEVGPCNIRVNSVACGFIDTTMNNTYTDSEKRAFVDNHIALCSMGSTQDIANAVAFLASNDAKYITGQTLSVDGGYY